MKKPKRILLTGGAGYLGSILLNKLLARGYQVTVVDNLIYNSHRPQTNANSEKSLHFICKDIRDIRLTDDYFSGIDAIIHLAGIVGDEAYALNPDNSREINFESTINLAKISKEKNIKRFIFASSCSVYGQGQKKLDENALLCPVSLYAKDKIESERAILSLLNRRNFQPTLLRMSTLYGYSPRPRFDLVLNLLTALATTKNKFNIYGGSQWRPLLHVSDAADAYIKVLESPLSSVGGQIFNLGCDGQNYQISKIGEVITRLIPTSCCNTMNMDTCDKRDYKVDFRKIKNVLNFKNKFSIENGIAELKIALETKLVTNFMNTKYNNYKYLLKNSSKLMEGRTLLSCDK